MRQARAGVSRSGSGCRFQHRPTHICIVARNTSLHALPFARIKPLCFACIKPLCCAHQCAVYCAHQTVGLRFPIWRNRAASNGMADPEMSGRTDSRDFAD
jgi:hypothetical protein